MGGRSDNCKRQQEKWANLISHVTYSPPHTSTQTPRCVREKRFPLLSCLSQWKTTHVNSKLFVHSHLQEKQVFAKDAQDSFYAVSKVIYIQKHFFNVLQVWSGEKSLDLVLPSNLSTLKEWYRSYLNFTLFIWSYLNIVNSSWLLKACSNLLHFPFIPDLLS